MSDVRRELTDAIYEHEEQHYCRDCAVAITTEYRKEILRSLGWDEDSPAATNETVYGHRVIVDDDLPANPGFEIRGEHL
jgi:hypothetical protein